MRILIDENLNWRLRRELPGHEVESVPLLGWAGIQNGHLLRRASAEGFQVLVTMDGHLLHQQNLSLHPIAIVALKASSNRIEDTRPLMSQILALLSQLQPGTLTVVE